MGKPVAKQGDRVVGVDTHIILVPSPAGPVPTSMPMPFSGALTADLAESILIDGRPAAVVGSQADNLPPHIPMGGPFQSPPSNKGTVTQGCDTVLLEGRAAARAGDPVKCCNDPSDQETGAVVAIGTVISS